MKQNIPISVVMPVFNSENFLSAAIESILNQSFKNFEFVIVDDGSKDKSLEIIKTYAEKDNRIKIITQKNKGVSAALNTGIAKAEGEWIAIMHSDDIAHPRRLEKQLNFVNENLDLVATGTYAYHVNTSGKIIGFSKTGPINKEEFTKIRKECNIISIIHPTAFYKKMFFLKAGGYNEDFKSTEDIDLFERMAKYGTIFVLPEPLLKYRIHSNSLSMTRFFEQKMLTRFIRERQRYYKMHKKKLTLDDFVVSYYKIPLVKRLIRKADDLSQFYYRNAGLNFGEERYFVAIRFLTLSFLLNPLYASKRLWNQYIKFKITKVKTCFVK